MRPKRYAIRTYGCCESFVGWVEHRETQRTTFENDGFRYALPILPRFCTLGFATPPNLPRRLILTILTWSEY